MITVEDDFPKPSCILEGFSDTIMLEEDMDHRVSLKVYQTMDEQLYRWTCAPTLNQILSEDPVCPFETRPLTLNPQLMISDKEFSPSGAKFELTLSMVRQNTNIGESCSVFVQKKFTETAQEEMLFTVEQDAQVIDPTRANSFICEPQSPVDELFVYTWEVVDAFKGSKVMLADLQQDGNKLIIGANQFRFNREYQVKCAATSASVRGNALHSFKTVEKASDIKLAIKPEAIGTAETTMFTITATKAANEDLSCRFFQDVDGKDERIDDETRSASFSKEAETIEVTLRKSDKVKGSQTVKIMVYCSSEDMTAQYIKSADVFLKPKPEPVTAEVLKVDD